MDEAYEKVVAAQDAMEAYQLAAIEASDRACEYSDFVCDQINTHKRVVNTLESARLRGVAVAAVERAKSLRPDLAAAAIDLIDAGEYPAFPCGAD